ncbi:MAG TPA: carboxyl transferase domain-containing protein [Nocardioides sp.]|uniref:carboxyl transferase domain-containing protein n=1 Tax=Nocardioides sp. TaxID=35761 RepID=UPI002E2F6E6A|nr:carboxyl transferase domain-containing protein [Nocardioides sp.]HEX5088898.1 carboxyl transferase domain-containing protein [Nocardioides sp.]
MSEQAPHRWTVQELLDLVLDEGSFESWDEPIDISDAAPDYRAELETAREKAGTDESVVTGRGLVHGRPVAVVANEFRFLAGSIGLAAARRIISAVRRATAERLPILASTASGGTRMQEGTPAFVKMVEISRALMEHRAAGLPYLAYLRHPTTGGVYASWGSLAHVTVGEPGALIGFLGPKVFEALNGRPFPPNVQLAENLKHHGVIDGLATAEELPVLVDQVLSILVDAPSEPRLTRRTGEPAPDLDAWAAIEQTRSEERIGVRDVLRAGAEVVLPLSGTEKGERDSTVLVVMARIDGEPCLVVGQDRSRQGPGTPMGPGALRTARRAMRLANEMRLPLVTVIDTPGAELSQRAEEGAIAGEIARCLAGLATMRVPTVSVILGQGCGGGALALLPAQRVIAAEKAWLMPLPPEGASVIVHGDTAHADQQARGMRIRAVDLLVNGTVHHVVPEPPGDTGAALAAAVAAEIAAAIRAVRT